MREPGFIRAFRRFSVTNMVVEELYAKDMGEEFTGATEAVELINKSAKHAMM